MKGEPSLKKPLGPVKTVWLLQKVVEVVYEALNPFGGNITVIDNSNTGGTNPSGTSYTMAMNALKNKELTASQRNFIVCVRYKGDQAPITSISISYS